MTVLVVLLYGFDAVCLVGAYVLLGWLIVGLVRERRDRSRG